MEIKNQETCIDPSWKELEVVKVKSKCKCKATLWIKFKDNSSKQVIQSSNWSNGTIGFSALPTRLFKSSYPSEILLFALGFIVMGFSSKF